MILNYTYVNQSNHSILSNPDSEVDSKSLLNSTLTSPMATQLGKPLSRKFKFIDRSRPLNRMDFQTDASGKQDLRTISLFEKAADSMSRYDLNGQLKSSSRLYFNQAASQAASAASKPQAAVTLLPQKTPNRTIILIPKPKLSENYRLPPHAAKIHPVIKNDLIRRSRSFTVNPRDRNRIINYIVGSQNAGSTPSYSLMNSTLPTVIDETTRVEGGNTTELNLDETSVDMLNESIYTSSEANTTKGNTTTSEYLTRSSLNPTTTTTTQSTTNSSLPHLMNATYTQKLKLLKQYINLNDENNMNAFYYNNSNIINNSNNNNPVDTNKNIAKPEQNSVLTNNISSSTTSNSNIVNNSANNAMNIINNLMMTSNSNLNNTTNSTPTTTSTGATNIANINGTSNVNTNTTSTSNQTTDDQAHKALIVAKPNELMTNTTSTTNINIPDAISSVKNGVSFSSGESGFFPSKHVERAAESDTWKLHKSHLFVNNSPANNSTSILTNKPQNIQQNPNLYQQQLQQRTASIIEKSRNSLINIDTKTIAHIANAFYSENSYMQKRFQANPHRSLQNPGSLRFFFARHGERIDLAFGPQWIEQAFDRTGKYRRINLNMPGDLPARAIKREFIGDSPLTEIGKFQAKLTGEALGNEGYKIHYCYASPALRCIQTAHQVLQAQGIEKIVKIRIEPSLFEFLGWYDKGIPTFLNFEPLIQFGYNLDVSYKPLLPVERLQTDESYTDYYQRSFNITKYLSQLHQNEGANILAVGHAGTLEVCTRQICGFPIRQYSEFNATIRKVPYLGMCLLEKDASSQIFEIQQAVIPPLAHTANFNFDPASLKI